MLNAKRFVRSFMVIGAVLLVLSCFSGAGFAQDIAEKADAYVEGQTQSNGFSGSVLIAQNGKVLLDKGYGMADLEQQISNTQSTMFRLGSVTKQFTAAAIMKLQEKGLLKVSDPIKKYIPDYPNGDQITIHNLLTHTSGIPDFVGLPEYIGLKAQSVKPEKVIAVFKDLPLEFTPGERFNYSNSGYVLLGYIIEKVSGKSYETYLKENIFKPLGMSNTGYDHNDKASKNRAEGYHFGDGGIEKASFIDMSVPFAAGGLYSTVEDMYIWDRALYTEKILSKKSINEMFTPFMDNYGYGWDIRDSYGHKVIDHDGAIDGFGCQITRLVDDDTVIIVLANNDCINVGEIAYNIEKMVLGVDEQLQSPEEPESDESDEQSKVDANPELYDNWAGVPEIQASFNVAIATKTKYFLTGKQAA